jgi:hemin uptake protein HemP
VREGRSLVGSEATLRILILNLNNLRSTGTSFARQGQKIKIFSSRYFQIVGALRFAIANLLTWSLNNYMMLPARSCEAATVFSTPGEHPKAPLAGPPSPAPLAAPTEVIAADDLFRGRKEICIEHGGVRYRLRITRRNRLILQK